MGKKEKKFKQKKQGGRPVWVLLSGRHSEELENLQQIFNNERHNEKGPRELQLEKK